MKKTKELLKSLKTYDLQDALVVLQCEALEREDIDYLRKTLRPHVRNNTNTSFLCLGPNDLMGAFSFGAEFSSRQDFESEKFIKILRDAADKLEALINNKESHE